MPIIYTYPSATPVSEDYLLISDVSETEPENATRKCTVGDIVSLVGALVPGGGTVTSVGLSMGTTGLTVSSDTTNPIITTGTFTVAGTLDADNGGTGHASYAIGDILYASGATALSKLTFASAPAGNGDILTLAAGVPSWQTPTYMTSWTYDADSGATPTVASGDNVSFDGGTHINTVAAAGPDTLTINHANVTNTPTVSGPTALIHGGNFTAIDTVTLDAQGHLIGQNTKTYTLPAAGGSVTNHGFSPVPIAICDNALGMVTSNTYYYLTIAEHNMTINSLTIWGRAAGAVGDISFAIYRYPWGTGALMGTSTISGAAYGPNNKGITPVGVGTMDVTAGESIIVGLSRTTGTWDTISDDGYNDAMFGLHNTVTAVFPSTSPVATGDEVVSFAKRFALTLWAT